MTSPTLPSPYLIFLGDLKTQINAKTGQGLVDWCPEKCLGQLRLPGCIVDLGIPDLNLEEARAAGAQSLVLGLAPVGGNIDRAWIPIFAQALELGLHIINGLHVELAKIPALASVLESVDAQIIQVRTPPEEIPIGTGKKRTGKRVVMVGSDCGVGKKYSALCLHRALVNKGIKATFRATGQTGIMISGQGMPMDAVKADFLAGAAEMLSPNNDPDHWDVIEGQGALHHPGYASVSLGILHGSKPDAFVLCHEATRKELDGFPGFMIGDLNVRIQETITYGRTTNPSIQCVGVSVNTSWLKGVDYRQYLNELQQDVGLPCVDPMKDALDPIIHNLLKI